MTASIKPIVIAVTAALALAALPAAAAEGAWRVGESYIVRSGALDLSTAEGRETYLAHIRRAARKACAGEPSAGARTRCIDDAVGGAVAAASPGARTGLRLALQDGGRGAGAPLAVAEAR